MLVNQIQAIDNADTATPRIVKLLKHIISSDKNSPVLRAAIQELDPMPDKPQFKGLSEVRLPVSANYYAVSMTRTI